MSIQYNVVRRPNTINRNAPDKYYLSLVQKDVIDMEYMVNAISNYSTVNPPDVLAVLESLFRLLPKELANGRGIRLGKLGSFSLTATATGREQEEEVSPKDIQKINLRFRPSPRLKGQLGELTFERIKE